ncbi:MAG: NAD(P)-dependent oxidoreductase [Eubacterium sp.]|nr:NAD(P)-dependent oxidoreductase [Eubacterium sp.]
MREIKSAVVTGATGAIGISLCRLLLSKGVTVYAACRNSPRLKNLPDGVKLIVSDISEIGRLDKTLGESVDAFFHLAWAGTTGDGRNDPVLQNKNVGFALEALRCAKRLGAKVFVGAGSQAEYGKPNVRLTPETECKPETEYGKAKLRAELLLKEESKNLGIACLFPRILSVYGPFESESSVISTTVNALLAVRRPSLTEGSQLWDFLYCDDAARALLLLAEKGKSGAVYVLASGDTRPLKDYLCVLRDAVDGSFELGFGEIESPSPLSLSADISALTEDTGFVPLVSFEEGIERTVNYYKNKLV